MMPQRGKIGRNTKEVEQLRKGTQRRTGEDEHEETKQYISTITTVKPKTEHRKSKCKEDNNGEKYTGATKRGRR